MKVKGVKKTLDNNNQTRLRNEKKNGLNQIKNKLKKLKQRTFIGF